MCRVPAVPLIAVLVVLACAGTAGAALPAGALTQLPFPSGCFASAAIGGCSTPSAASRPINLAVTADGAQVYVLGQSGGLRAMNRDAAGALTHGPLVPDSIGGYQGDGVSVNRDGTRVAAAGGEPSGSGRVSLFTRAPDGTLTPLVCADDLSGQGCLERDGLAHAAGVALPPTGPGLYVAGREGAGDGGDGDTDGDGALLAFHSALNPITLTPTLVQDACVAAVASPVSGDECESPLNTTAAVGDVTDVAVSPDGATVYAGGFAGLVGFARNAQTGALATRVACFLRNNGNSGCGDDARMSITEDLAFDPSGEFLYAAARDRLIVFDRQPLSGGLTLVQCMKAGGGDGCVDVPEIGLSTTGVAVAPDGRTAYVTRGGAHHVLSLRRDPGTGLLSPLGCVSFDPDPGCSPAAGVYFPYEVAVAPGSPSVYVAAIEGTGQNATGALSSFRAAQAPICTDAAVTVAAGAAVALPLACSDPDGDPLTLAIAGPPSDGALSAIDQGAPSVAYTAPPTAGARTVSFTASDGANTSAPATVAITVTGGAAPSAGASVTSPRSRIGKLAARIRQSRLKRFSGTATGPVRRVELSLVRLQGGARIAVARCQVLGSKGALRPIKPSKKAKRCSAGGFLTAKGTTTWSLTLRRPLPKGSYVLTSRAVGAGTARETRFSSTLGNRRSFKVV